MAWKNRGSGQPLFAVQLNGAPGNQSGIGAKVIARYEDGTVRATEMTAGNGYISQSPPVVYFHTAATPIRELEVRWPDGETTKATPDANAPSLTISKRLLSNAAQ